MSLRLILMRHAKSSWDNPVWTDHERPLNKRGHKSARALGAWLASNGHLPDQVLCSTSERTRETCDRLGLTAPVVFLDSLYHPSTGVILDSLHQSATGDTVLIITHNPACATFADRIVTAPPPHSRFHDYPTGATLVVDLPITTWRAASFRTGSAVDFVVPRDLIE